MWKIEPYDGLVARLSFHSMPERVMVGVAKLRADGARAIRIIDADGSAVPESQSAAIATLEREKGGIRI